MSAMNEAYDAGFAGAARWAMRMDLCSDMDSPAYMATRERAVSRLGPDEALLADAERYRALRHAYLAQSPAWADIIKQVPVFNQVTFDAAIDAAMNGIQCSASGVDPCEGADMIRVCHRRE